MDIFIFIAKTFYGTEGKLSTSSACSPSCNIESKPALTISSQDTYNLSLQTIQEAQPVQGWGVLFGGGRGGGRGRREVGKTLQAEGSRQCHQCSSQCNQENSADHPAEQEAGVDLVVTML